MAVSSNGVHATSQDAAMAALIRAYGIEDEHSAIVQAKLRLVVPALASFVVSCLSEIGGTGSFPCVTPSTKHGGDLVKPPLAVSPPLDPPTNRPHGKVRAVSVDKAPLVTDDVKYELVQKIPCFSGLDQAALTKLVNGFEVKRYLEHEDIAFPGDSQVGMHIIVEGEAKVSEMQHTGMLGQGEAFGDLGLLTGTSTNQGLEAYGGEVVTLRLEPQVFEALDIKKEVIATKPRRKIGGAQKIRRAQMAASEVPAASEPGVAEEDKTAFIEAVKSNPTIEDMLHLTDEQFEYMATVAIRRTFAKDQVVFEKGAIGDAFYVVQEGAFSLCCPPEVLSNRRQDIKLRCGDTFGELALLYDAPRSLAVKCVQDGAVWMVTKAAFRSVITLSTSLRIKRYRELIDTVPLFNSIQERTKADLCNALEEMHFTKGEDIVKEGDVGDSFYLVSHGTCLVVINGEVKSLLKTGDFFGERALLQDEPRSATVRVESESCSVLGLDRMSFKMISQAVRASLSMTDPELALPNLSDCYRIPKSRLQRIGFLGQGAFGFVTLERDPETEKLFALKAMSKGHIVKEKLTAAVKNEVSCMKRLLDSRFITKLADTYQDISSVYLLLEPCFGGELLQVYNENGFWGSEPHAQFYVGSATLGLEYMHERKIIYRDLKLENCLLTSTGQLKLTDMGIAKVVLGLTYTVCGTKDYFAPETLRQHGHNRAVDWWALGILTFIMLAGQSPFEAREDLQVFKNICKGFAKVKIPAGMSTNAIGMITALCRKKPEERITMTSGGIKNLQGHAWFADLDWNKLAMGDLEAPWSPPLDEKAVVAKISAKPQMEAPQFEYENDDTNWDECFSPDERSRGSVLSVVG